MKIRLKVLFVLFVLMFTLSLKADTKYSIGMGLSNTMYSGLGFNLALLSKNDMKYISYGFKSYQSHNGAFFAYGLGWVRTDLISSESNKHGLGLFLGLVDEEYYDSRKSDNVYGYGLTYNYFFNTLEKSGTNIGLSFVNYDYSGKNKAVLSFAIGYQF